MIVANDDRVSVLYPILLRHVIPFFVGKDARELDQLVDEIYRHDSNYKMQVLALWVCVASVEFALLDMMGQMVGTDPQRLRVGQRVELLERSEHDAPATPAGRLLFTPITEP